ncbi:MAG: FKBP-type peptidyl-prolyl cis-trans isomerase [Oscillospiraceae bacterium]|nr:FKBP-type peptidyl-prolyl cis-trans isomerase [Oscillospiraceae bacterium]
MKHQTKRIAVLLSVLLIISLLSACGPTSRVPTLDDLAASTSAAATTAATTAAPVNINDTKYDISTFTFSDYLDENGYFEGVTALDYVKLPAYESISIPADVHTISDEAVQEQIDLLQESAMYYEELTDRAVENGDSVNIDYVGTVDGVEFEGGSTGGAGTIVTIGVTNYIDDFLEQLIGHTPGETVKVEVTFPEDYQEKTLAGKDAVFTTTINYIQGDEIYPEINDEFVVATYGDSRGWTTVDELREALRDGLQKSAVSNYIEEYLIENSTFSSVPQELYDYQACSVIYNCAASAASYGLDLATYLKYVVNVETVSALLESQDESINHYSRLYLVIQAIADDSGIVADDAMIETYFADLIAADVYDGYADFYGKPYMHFVALNDTILSDLLDNAVLA